ncbi:unnamed protein product [Bursaphelenchus okinawaensis]|uniref:Nanos-type domain-containing protein n=1 Tax=Bursaphelenchus okinawaensis TaxID=465554 RepID=A0A811JRH4_9BILA|nr:unnamed protein product [Bursaphelenchus okinawaensis]CAG9079915.1 unnamed protein product [Bursaphelenchus okinawaensis]
MNNQELPGYRLHRALPLNIQNVRDRTVSERITRIRQDVEFEERSKSFDDTGLDELNDIINHSFYLGEQTPTILKQHLRFGETTSEDSVFCFETISAPSDNRDWMTKLFSSPLPNRPKLLSRSGNNNMVASPKGLSSHPQSLFATIIVDPSAVTSGGTASTPSTDPTSTKSDSNSNLSNSSDSSKKPQNLFSASMPQRLASDDHSPCAYCISTNRSRKASTHSKYSCPVLAALKPCKTCGASGINNHTAMHCPERKTIRLRLKTRQPKVFTEKDLPSMMVFPLGYYNKPKWSAPIQNRARWFSLTNYKMSKRG